MSDVVRAKRIHETCSILVVDSVVQDSRRDEGRNGSLRAVGIRCDHLGRTGCPHFELVLRGDGSEILAQPEVHDDLGCVALLEPQPEVRIHLLPLSKSRSLGVKRRSEIQSDPGRWVRGHDLARGDLSDVAQEELGLAL